MSPAKLHADIAYDSGDLRRGLRARSITLRLARRGIDSSERLGRYRRVVERTQAWLPGCRRLGVRYERRLRPDLPYVPRSSDGVTNARAGDFGAVSSPLHADPQSGLL